MNWSNITENEEIIKLLVERKKIEDKIKAIDEKALIMYELEILALPDNDNKPNSLINTSNEFVLLTKANYKAKDGTIKQGLYMNNKYYAPKDDI